MNKHFQKVLKKLKTSKDVKALGFSRSEIKGIAAKIADNLDVEDNASDEDVDGAIDEAISTSESKKDLLPSDRLRAAIETFILGGMKYPDLTRRIIYLNSTEGSALYGSFSRIYDIFNDLITQAKEDGEFDPEANSYMIIDMVFGIFLIALYQWIDIDHLSPVELLERTRAYYDQFIVEQFKVK